MAEVAMTEKTQEKTVNERPVVLKDRKSVV